MPPHVLEVADPSRNEDQVERAGAENLKCDVDVVASRVHRLRVAGCLRYLLMGGPDPRADLAARVEAELVANLLYVVLGRALRDPELHGDLTVREAVGDELGDLPFAPAQLGPFAHRARVALSGRHSRY